jgi:transcriptional regulator with XRE-family HTH domain
VARTRVAAAVPAALEDIGGRLRALRTEKRLSLREAARRASLTPSFVSQVELNQVRPSLSTLRRLCDALQVTVMDVLESDGQMGRSIVRAKSRKRLVSPDAHFDMQLLCEAPGRPFDFVIVHMGPGSVTSDDLHSHGTKECVFVVKGQATIEFSGGQKEVLEAGDSLYYSATTPHRVVSTGRGELVLVSCMVGGF